MDGWNRWTFCRWVDEKINGCMGRSMGEKLVDRWMDGWVECLCRVRIEIRPFAAPEGYGSLTGQLKFTSA